MRIVYWIVGIGLALSIIGGAAYLGVAQNEPTVSDAPTAPITVAVSRGNVQKTVTAPGQLIGTREELLSMGVNGRLINLTVRPGTIVQAGDIIAQVDPAPFEEAVHIAQLQLSQAEAAYAQQLASADVAINGSEARVDSVRAQMPLLTAAEIDLAATQDAEARAAYEYQKAVDRHWEPPEVQEAYRQEWERAKQSVQIAQARYDEVLRQQWGVSQQVEALQAESEQAELTRQFLSTSGVDPLLETAVSQAEKALAATTLVAPFSGVVLDVYVKPGTAVATDQAIILLADPTQAEVRTTVIEEDLSLVQISQPAELFLDALPQLELFGQVSRIVPQRIVGEARPLYHVYITLDAPLPDATYPGMTADSAIVVAEEPNVLRLPRALVQARSDGTAVLDLWDNDSRTAKTVEVGLKGDIYITILSGLAEGDEVVGE